MKFTAEKKYNVWMSWTPSKCGSCWTLTNIYAPCQNDIKLEFLAWLDGVQIPEDADVLQVGDFNLTRNMEDMSKPGGNINEML